jgi:hypothetical protein
MTRREVHLLMLQAAQAAAQTSNAPPGLKVQLSAADMKELQTAADRALRDARWLEELPLDGILPAFVFTPR